MTNTIDKQVSKVIKKENQKLSPEQRLSHKTVLEIEKMTGYQESRYIIAPKDTIGKSVRYNVSK